MKKKRMKICSLLLSTTIAFTGCSSETDEMKDPKSNSVKTEVQETEPSIDDTESEEEYSSDSIVVDMLPTTRAIELTETQKSQVKKSNDFSFNFYRILLQAQASLKSNITSPLSIKYVLSMLNAGANGDTASEIASVLGCNADETVELNGFCKTMIEDAPLVDPSVTLRIANGLFPNKGVDLSDSYVKEMNDYYHAEVKSLDYTVPSSIDYINDWCSKQTGGMIHDIVNAVDAQSKMVVMNAIYFKATWAEKFHKAETDKSVFTHEDGTPIFVNMMHRKAAVWYSQNDLYTTLWLPYGGMNHEGYFMAVLLPKEGKTISEVVASLTHDSWSKNLQAKKTDYIVDIEIPRFSTESDITLNETIAAMGAPSMFTHKADFSLMTSNKESLFVGLLKQKAGIAVTEEGTKLSAATIALMYGAPDVKRQQTEFHANRPFVYIVQEAGTGAVFFIGAFMG